MKTILTIILIALCISVAGQIREPLRHYSFDDAGAATGLEDSSGNGATLKMYGNPTFSTTLKAAGSSSISLDGTGDMLTIPTTDLTNEFFVSFWARTNTDITSYRGMFSKAGANSFAVQTEATNLLYANSYISSTNNTSKVSVWTRERWHHVVAYFNDIGSVTKVRLFVDGAKLTLADSLIATGIDVNDSIYIGASASRGILWIGQIDEMRIYTGFAPYQAQIDSLYQKTYIGAPGSAPTYNPIVGRHVRFYANGIELKDKGRDGSFRYWRAPSPTLIPQSGLNKLLTDQDYDGVCPSGESWETDCDCAVNYFSRAPLRAIADVTDFANVKYIDFTDTGSTEAGTEAEPYNSWDDWTWAANTAYLFKRGIIYTTSSEIVIDGNNIFLGTYGTGDTAIIRGSHVGHTISLDGSGNIYTLRDLKFEAPAAYDNIIATNVRNSNCAINIGKTLGDSYVKVDIIGCQVYNSPFGLRTGYPVEELRVINCKLHRTAIEGAYTNGRYMEFRFTDIYDFNRWALTQPEIHYEGGTNTGSTGDGIQAEYWNQMLIANSLIDHGSTKNKGTIMLHSDNGEWDQEAKIIAYNILVGPENGSTAVQTVNQSSSAKGLLFKGNLCFESPLNNNETVGFWNGSAGADTVINNVFVGYGIAVYQATTDNSLYDNNTFYDNTNCVYASPAKTIPSFRNNITYNNTNVFTNIVATLNSNNVSSNPSFVNPTLNRTTADFSLQAGSSAINAGTTINYVPIDIKGTERPSGEYDAGAYEH